MSSKRTQKKKKFFVLEFQTPSYQDPQYKLNRDNYQQNIKRFHQLSIVKKTNLNKRLDGFYLKLILNNKTLWSGKKISWVVFKKICSQYKFKSSNLSLYSDYNPKCSQKTFGFKNREKALDTLKQLKKKPIKYQLQVITTMLGRAKYHPHKNLEMSKAISVFEDWLREYHLQKFD